MSSIKRYSPLDIDAEMYEFTDGDFVRFTDHQSAIDRLTIERDIANMAAENYRKLLAVANDLVAYQTQIIQRLQVQP